MTYFETERLLVRSLSENDLRDFVDYRSDPGIVIYQDFDILNESEAQAFLTEHAKRFVVADDSWTQLGVVLKVDKKLIGDCAIKLSSDNQAHVGVTISATYQKKGYAKEVLLGLFTYLKSRFGVQIIVGIVDSRNDHSNALMRGLGFELAKRVDEVPFKGTICTEFYYKLPI